jgi:KipI family sensor histidine kinase inhibitor
MFFYPPLVRPMGEAALLIDLGAEIDAAVNARVHAFASALDGTAGVVETIPGFASLLVRFDPAQVSQQGVREYISRVLNAPTPELPAVARVIQIPTRYGGEFGPDLEFVAQQSHLSAEQVIRLHTGRPFRVFMLGFAPGFPYAGPLPPEIAAPRLETPRDHVPAGSVGIAGRQTGIYPRASPGGWRLIGRTDIRLFDPIRDPPALLKPGDLLRFVQVLT